MAVLTATNGNVQVAEGALTNIPAAAFTIAGLFRRAGTTTDGFEAILALVTGGGSVITNIGTTAAAAPYAVSFGHGGFTRTFGFSDLANDEAYLFVVVKSAGEVTPRANLYRFDAISPAWDGWADGSGTVDDNGNTIGGAWLLNQPGGFPLNGGVFAAAVWDTALSESAITDGSTGLHVGVQQWLDLGPIALWRPGETDPVEDESAEGTSDETSSAGVTIVDEDPTGFNMDFGGGPVVVDGSGSVTLGGLTAAGTGRRRVHGTATVDLGALTATGTGHRTVHGTAAASLGPLAATGTGRRRVHAQGAAGLGALTVAGVGRRRVHGSGAISLGGLVAAGAGARTVRGAALVALGGLTAIGAGHRAVHASGLVQLGGLTVSGVGADSGVVPGTLTPGGTSPTLTAGGTTLATLTPGGSSPSLIAS